MENTWRHSNAPACIEHENGSGASGDLRGHGCPKGVEGSAWDDPIHQPSTVQQQVAQLDCDGLIGRIAPFVVQTRIIRDLFQIVLDCAPKVTLQTHEVALVGRQRYSEIAVSPSADYQEGRGIRQTCELSAKHSLSVYHPHHAYS